MYDIIVPVCCKTVDMQHENIKHEIRRCLVFDFSPLNYTGPL